MGLGEELMVAAFEAGLGVTLPRPFPRMTYAEAMDRYGCDKPDTRFGMELRDVSALVRHGACRIICCILSRGFQLCRVAHLRPTGARLRLQAVHGSGCSGRCCESNLRAHRLADRQLRAQSQGRRV